MPVGKNKSGNWYVDIRSDGRRIRKVIREARTKEQARIAEAYHRDLLFRRKYIPEPKRKLFRDFVHESFLPYSKTNKRSYSDDVRITRVLCDFFKGKFLHEITPGLIESYKRHRAETPTRGDGKRAPATINRELAVLGRILTMAVDEEYLENNPIRRVKKFKVDNARIRFLTTEEEACLMEALANRPQTKQIVTLALYTGMRRGEIFNLKWKNVDFSRDLLIVRQTKTSKDRTIPMCDQVRQLLRELRPEESKPDQPVFVSEKTGGKLTDIKHSFTSACRKAGIEDFHFHDLRHSAGTRLAEAGVHAVVIAEILGHKSLAMTKRYTHATDWAKKEAIQKLAQYGKLPIPEFGGMAMGELHPESDL